MSTTTGKETSPTPTLLKASGYGNKWAQLEQSRQDPIAEPLEDEANSANRRSHERPKATPEEKEYLDNLLQSFGAELELDNPIQSKLMGYCPVHLESSKKVGRRTLLYNRNRGRIRCNYCHMTGDATMLMARIWGIPLQLTMETLEKDPGLADIQRPPGTGDAAIMVRINWVARETLRKDERAMKTFRDRGHNSKALEKHGIGWNWRSMPIEKRLLRFGITEQEIEESRLLTKVKYGYAPALESGMQIASEDRAGSATWIGVPNNMGSEWIDQMGKVPGLVTRHANLVNMRSSDNSAMLYVTDAPSVYLHCLENNLAVALQIGVAEVDDNCRYINSMNAADVRVLAVEPENEDAWLDLLYDSDTASSTKNDPVWQFYCDYVKYPHPKRRR